MAPTAYIKIKNGTTGAVKSVVTATGRNVPPGVDADNGFLALDWRKKRNDVHMCKFVLNYDSPDVALLSDKDQIEVVRSDFEHGVTEYTSFDGLFRDNTVEFSDKRMQYTAYAYSYEHMLTWRDIGYPSGKANYTKFTTAKAETILKTLVNSNIGATALASNGRVEDAVYTGFSIEADSARGNTLSIEISHQKLLDALKKIVDSAGGDFKVTRTGLLTFRFDWIVPTDLSTGAAAVVFSLENANMGDPKLAQMRSQESTVAFVGGAGEDANRVVRAVHGANYSATNRIEMFVDARNSGSDTTILDGIGAIKLKEIQFRNVIEYDVLQTPTSRVEKDYFLGNKIKAVFAGVTATQYVDELIFAYRNGKEDVSVAMKDA